MIINGLTIVAILILLAAAGGTAVWLLLRREDDGDPFAHAGLTVHPIEGFTGWEMPPEIACEPPTEILTAPIAPPWAPVAAEVADPPPPPPVTNPAAAAERISPEAQLPPPPVHHDEYAPPQRWHEPAPAAPHPDEAHQAALAVGAAIAATHAQIAEKQAARKAELADEARKTRPWEDDTGTFTFEALGLGRRAGDPLDVPDGPLSRPLEVFHEQEAGV